MGRSKNICFFNNYKFFINPNTNEFIMKFICNDCKKEFDSNELGNYQVPISIGGTPQYEKTKFWCEDCFNKIKQSNNISTPKEKLDIVPIESFNTDKNTTEEIVDDVYAELYNSLGVEPGLLSKTAIGNKINEKYRLDDIDAKIYSQKIIDDPDMINLLKK